MLVPIYRGILERHTGHEQRQKKMCRCMGHQFKVAWSHIACVPKPCTTGTNNNTKHTKVLQITMN